VGKRFVSYAEQLRREGFREGFREGLREGIREARCTILRRQLVLRFDELPESVVARLKAAKAAQLARWAVRLVTATTLDEVFSRRTPPPAKLSKG
jgi:flagellar biosynthesis/type III secretory pathway protein FliH